MLSQHILTVLEDWRSEFESDAIVNIRDFSQVERRNKRYVRKTFNEIAEQLGLSAISFGSCRMVFALDEKRVLKVGFSRWGLQANILEAKISNNLSPEIHAVVHAAAQDGLWLVQECVQAVDIDLRTKESVRLRKALSESAGCSPYVTDFRRNNVGRRPNGSLVLLDLELLSGEAPINGTEHVRRYLNW